MRLVIEFDERRWMKEFERRFVQGRERYFHIVEFREEDAPYFHIVETRKKDAPPGPSVEPCSNCGWGKGGDHCVGCYEPLWLGFDTPTTMSTAPHHPNLELRGQYRRNEEWPKVVAYVKELEAESKMWEKAARLWYKNTIDLMNAQQARTTPPKPDAAVPATLPWKKVDRTNGLMMRSGLKVFLTFEPFENVQGAWFIVDEENAMGFVMTIPPKPAAPDRTATGVPVDAEGRRAGGVTRDHIHDWRGDRCHVCGAPRGRSP